jgi:diguanylate cyclase (GGDEF)-like protein
VTNLHIGICAALGACVVVLIVLLVATRRRSRREAEGRVTDAVSALESRIDGLLDELASAVERAEDEARRGRLLGDLGGSLELDDVLSRTLEAARRLPGADAALLSLPAATESQSLTASLGLSEEEAERQAVSGPPGRKARSIGISYAYSQAEVEANGELIHGGLAVPMSNGAGHPVGYLTVFTRSPSFAFGDEHVERLEELVDRIGHLPGDSVLAELADRIRDVVRGADVACRVGGDEFAVILPESELQAGDQLYRRIQAAISARPLQNAGALRLSAGVAELRRGDDVVALFQRADDALYRAKASGKGLALSAE